MLQLSLTNNLSISANHLLIVFEILHPKPNSKKEYNLRIQLSKTDSPTIKPKRALIRE